MRVALSTPYADVRAADLVLAFDAPPTPPLEGLTLDLGGLPVALGVLGHSHQIIAGELTETLACVPGRPGDLPATHEAHLADGRRYSFTAEVVALERATAQSLVFDIAQDPNGIVGVFAGNPDAFTALRARLLPDRVHWETWHAYPQTQELVRTTGELMAR